jgi:hypothetical protein
LYGQTAHNRIVYASPPVGGSGYEKPQLGYALCAVFLRHIWGGGHCFAKPYYPPQTSYTAERYAKCPLKFFVKIMQAPTALIGIKILWKMT